MSSGLEVLPEVEEALSSFYLKEFDFEDLEGIHQGAVSELNLSIFTTKVEKAKRHSGPVRPTLQAQFMTIVGKVLLRRFSLSHVIAGSA
jgi:hypothetical protein